MSDSIYLVSLSQHKYLFTDDKTGESFLLGRREINPSAPAWISKNRYALKLREEGKISFEVKRKLTEREQLLERCKELDIVVGDGISIANMEKLIADKEKELEDAKK